MYAAQEMADYISVWPPRAVERFRFAERNLDVKIPGRIFENGWEDIVKRLA